MKKTAIIADICILVCLVISFSSSSFSTDNIHSSFRLITRPYEFNFFDWTIKAILDKVIIRASNIADYLNEDIKEDLVLDVIENIDSVNLLENEINSIYGNPEIKNPEIETINLSIELAEVENVIKILSPVFESIIEDQVTYILDSYQIIRFGQPFPPVIFQIGDLPSNLVISPRDEIKQIESISINSNLGIDKYDEMEKEVISKFNVSCLVVPIGGLGSYPTMVGLSSSLPWLIDTVTHEWIHNWLFFRPLGMNYKKTDDTRKMNETTASIVGNEIGILVIEKFYPQVFTEHKSETHNSNNNSIIINKPLININLELYKTRIHVDFLLSEGRIEEAERYMDTRRALFWEYGYHIRKINQAYFAFYGAYADKPGGAAGIDPIGPAIRELRDNSASLKSFLFSIARMSSSKDLFEAVGFFQNHDQ